MKAMTDSDNVAGADQYDLQDDVSPAIFSLRKIVNLFKYFPARNSLLQQEIIKSEKIEPQVILDCKTRWNTLEKNDQKIFKDPKSDKNSFTTAEARSLMERGNCEIVRDMFNCLKPVRLVVEALLNNDENFLTSEGIFSSLKKGMSSYEATRTLTPNLNMLLDALLTIRPTSTQNEIHFSRSGISVGEGN
jgi:hypothetical protein